MSSIGGIPQNNQSLAPSYAPLGKPAAGLESPENKDQTLPPVEEAGATEKNRNQPNQKVDALSPDNEEGARHRDERSAEPEEAEPQAEASALSAVAQISPLSAQVQLEVALLRAAALHANDHAIGKSGISGATAVDSFNSNAGQTLAPGSLLDQRS